jgi:ascorbate-specific PTS system EIIC-type component UlaA
MGFVIREILGWLFLILGLGLFALSLLFISEEPVSRYVQGSITAFIGFVLFRAGVHFLKVAVAARLFLEARPAPREAVPPLAAARRPGKSPG